MLKTKKRKILFALAGIVVIALIFTLVSIIGNLRHSDYQSLDKADQLVLQELNQFFSAEREKSIWKGYSLNEQTIVAMDGRYGAAYVINPKNPIRSLFAKEVTLPEGYSIRAYRIAAVAPQLLQFRGVENFNSVKKKYMLWGNEVYFTRYTADSTNSEPFHSQHYITFLSHEAFHYYMQNEWSHVGRFNTDEITAADLDLLESQYAVFEKMQQNLTAASPNRDALKTLCTEYVAIVQKRLALNPTYVNAELQSETEEGTATYVGIMASKAVGYPFDVMCFNKNGAVVEHLPFDTIIPAIKSGSMSTYSLASDFVYETGALLCQVMDALGIDDWQDTLNAQTTANTTTLYAIIRDFVLQQ